MSAAGTALAPATSERTHVSISMSIVPHDQTQPPDWSSPQDYTELARTSLDRCYLSRSAALMSTAWAAARRATGTRNGEHDT